MNFEEHIKIIMFFLMGLAVAFIVAFTFSSLNLWLSILSIIVIFVVIVIVLARSKDDIGKTD